jgi:peptide deformylase
MKVPSAVSEKMALLDILIYPDPRLRTVAEPVTDFGADFQAFLNDLIETMYAKDGIGLAATQVNAPKRVFVIDTGDGKGGSLLRVYVNPKLAFTEGSVEHLEGCLSVPEIWEKIERFSHIKLKAQNREGKPFELDLDFERDGVLTIAIQHELDHLDGILFVDKLSFLKQRIIKSKMKKLVKEREEQEEEESE